jgi:hypothetical protein
MPAPVPTTNGPDPAKSPTIPYIVVWSAEKPPAKRLTFAPGGRGIAFEDEVIHDRDAHGILWRRSTLHSGQGEPLFGRVHTARQRRTMRQLLCQVCGGPADRTDQGVLWLLGDHHEDWNGWPEGMAAPDPPVCLNCAALSTGLCPFLRRTGYVAVRVHNPVPVGVMGALYAPSPRGPVAVDGVIIGWDDWRAPWVLASQAVMQLRGCTVVRLEEELAAAGLVPPGS